jgi:hypothetical protein
MSRKQSAAGTGQLAVKAKSLSFCFRLPTANCPLPAVLFPDEDSPCQENTRELELAGR